MSLTLPPTPPPAEPLAEPPAEVRRRIDQHLDAVEDALRRAGAPRGERRSVSADLEAQIRDMLATRGAAGPPTLADAEAVLGRLDAPESYAGDVVPSAAPAPAPAAIPSAAPLPAGRRPRLSGVALAGLILILIGAPAPVACLPFTLDRIPQPVLVPTTTAPADAALAAPPPPNGGILLEVTPTTRGDGTMHVRIRPDTGAPPVAPATTTVPAAVTQPADAEASLHRTRLLERKAELRTHLQAAQVQLDAQRQQGMTDQHPAVLQLQQNLAQTQQELAAVTKELAALEATPAATSPAAPPAPAYRLQRPNFRSVVRTVASPLACSSPLLLGALALGLVAMVQIRRSGGALYGMGLAIFDMVFPVALLLAALALLAID